VRGYYIRNIGEQIEKIRLNRFKIILVLIIMIGIYFDLSFVFKTCLYKLVLILKLNIISHEWFVFIPDLFFYKKSKFLRYGNSRNKSNLQENYKKQLDMLGWV